MSIILEILFEGKQLNFVRVETSTLKTAKTLRTDRIHHYTRSRETQHMRSGFVVHLLF